MSVNPQKPEPREVLEPYKQLYLYAVLAEVKVILEDKDVLDKYSEEFFEMADGMKACFLGPDLDGFSARVQSAKPRLKKRKDEIAGGIIQNTEVAKELGERIQRALDVSEDYLNCNGET